MIEPEMCNYQSKIAISLNICQYSDLFASVDKFMTIAYTKICGKKCSDSEISYHSISIGEYSNKIK